MNKGDMLQQLKDHYNIGSDAELARYLDVKPNVVSNWKKRNTFDTELIYTKCDGISAEWLLTGLGNITSKNINQDETILSTNIGVPYFENIEATGSILFSYDDNNEQPSFYINYQHFDDCTAYLPVTGDSMYPKYCAGEIAALKRIINLDIIQWGEAYMVVTDSEANDLRTIKLLFPHKDEDKIILRSSNPEYIGDTIIPKKNIISLFIVKGKITRNQL